MAKITREQIKKINSKCQNGWELDVQYFIFHSEKTLKKIIEQDTEHYLEFRLDYNYNNQITLFINKFYHKANDEFATSNGLGKKKILEESPAPRKSINKLIEFTKTLPDDELMKINNETDVIRNIMFVPSEAF